MNDRSTKQRLAAGVVVATLVHFVAVPAVAVLMLGAAEAATRDGRNAFDQAEQSRDKQRDDRNAEAERQRDTSREEDDAAEEKKEDEDKVILGSDDAPERTSMAWLAYEDYLKLQAPQSDVLQPATQTQVDPTPLAAMPDDPTPPATVAREPQVLAMAQPGGATADPAADAPRVVPSQSQVTLPGPAVEQPRVDTPSTEGDASRNESPADAPMTIDNVPPADQPAADARLSAMGEPIEQEALNPIDMPADATPGPAPKAEGDDLALANRDHATGPENNAPEPMAQPAAEAEMPDPAGVPTQRDPAESPVDEEGAPVATLASATPAPDPLGAPATNRETAPAEASSSAATSQQDQGSARDVRPAPENRDQTTTPASAQPQDARPTAAPRTQSESPPASPDATVEARPGQVLTAAGIEVRTATPQFSLVTRITALPSNPLVRVTFNSQGEVIEAKFLKSTGYDNVDSPILSSLYKWKATGKKLEERGKGFSIIVRLKLTEE